MKIAVVIPVRNRKATVRKTITSVLEQTLAPARLLVVDDGSTDGTADSVDRWLSFRETGFPIEVVRTTHRGAGAARNAGYRMSEDCDAVCFLDSDDLWPVDFLHNAASALQSASVGIATSRIRMSGEIEETRSAAAITADPLKALLVDLGDPGILSAVAIRADLARKSLPFDERFPTGQDMSVLLPLAVHGSWSVIRCGKPCVKIIHSEVFSEAPNISHSTIGRRVMWEKQYREIRRRLSPHLDRQAKRMFDKAMQRRCSEAAWECAQEGQNLAAAMYRLRAFFYGL